MANFHQLPSPHAKYNCRGSLGKQWQLLEVLAWESVVWKMRHWHRGCLHSFLHPLQLATGGWVRNRWSKEGEEPGAAGHSREHTEKLVSGSEHLGSIQGHQLWVIDMGLTPCCFLLLQRVVQTLFLVSRAPPSIAAAQLH